MKAAAASSALAPSLHEWETGEVDDFAEDALDADDEGAPGESLPLPSFDEIYDRHLVFVWRALRALGVAPPFIDDAVQDVFVVVHRRLSTFERRAKLTSWLFGIAIRIARNYRRRQRPSEDLAEVEGRLPDHKPSPFEETSRSETVKLIERALDALDDKKRVVFVLMEIEQMTAEEVAALLGVNVNTVYSRRRHARVEFDRLVARSATPIR